jgi:UDP-N-acetylmuramoyl-L-alanyl-D-glutamate--2,6-diaminopimelate ligase
MDNTLSFKHKIRLARGEKTMPTLKELVVAVPEARIFGNENVEVAALAYDSRSVAPDTAFIAVRGHQRDGHEFIPQALERGATTIVADNEEALKDVPDQITKVLVPDTRLALANLACEYYGHPSREMTLVGITGTNGKTTTAHLIAEMLREAGYKSVGIIGTLGAATEKAAYETGRTTPESLDLQRLLADFLDGGSEAVVMEVSSHALAMQRVAGCAFDAGVFTNLTQDHLDFHEDMEDYFAAKAKLFSDVAAYSEQFKSFGAVINADDPYGRRLRDEYCNDAIYVTYGIENEAHLTAEAVHLTPSGMSFVARTKGTKIHLELGIIGRFNVYNVLAAVGFGLLKEMEPAKIQSALQRASAPEGRMEMIDCGQEFSVAVDYAHTPDGLKNVVTTVREFTPGKLITVFGCGGDRDRTKRPQMGAIAASFSDLCVVTSDNPRTEDPNRIVEDILSGTRQGHAETLVELDRRQAIELALGKAKKGDFVLVAGKGHETYQIFKDRTIHFDDREVVREFLEDRAKGGA